MLRHLVRLASVAVLLVFFLPTLKQIHWSYINYFSKYVVKVENLAGTSGGTGFYLKHRGKVYIITNQHVCNLATQGLLIISNKIYTYGATVYKIYPYSDLCAINAPAEQTSGLSIARWHSIHQRIFIIGHPLLEPTTITEGEISDYTEITIPYKINVMSMTAQVLGGNSGSPVVDNFGNVVGVAFAGYQSRSYAVPYEDLYEFAESL